MTTAHPGVRADAALVLEGGGMRAQYASGAMDCFLKAGICFPYVIGVSAGISNAASYVAGQFERNRQVFTRFAGDPRYFSWRNWVTQGNPFGMDFIYRELPNHLPFDFAAFAAAPVRFRIGATDCATGRAVYFDKGEAKLEEALLASSSLPLVGRMAAVNGRVYLDGGIAGPIPFRQAEAGGFGGGVVVVARGRGHFRLAKPPHCGQEVLGCEGVGFGYEAGNWIFRGVDLAVQKGEKLAVVGPNGAGKTTLLRVMAG